MPKHVLLIVLAGFVVAAQSAAPAQAPAPAPPVPYLKKNGKYVFVDPATMKPAFEREFDRATWLFEDGLAIVRANGKAGVIDPKGAEIVPIQYDAVEAFNEGVAVVITDEKRGLVDRTGKELIEPMFEVETLVFSEGLAAIEEDEKWGFVDRTGKMVIEARYDEVTPFVDGVAVFLGTVKGKDRRRGRGIIDKNRKMLVPPKYRSLTPLGGGRFVAENKIAKWGIINRTGHEIVPFAYSFVDPCKGTPELMEITADVPDGGTRIGLVDKDGTVVVAPRYGYLYEFADGLAPVAYRFSGLPKGETATPETWGFIDKTGKLVIPMTFKSTFGFSEGLASVETESGWGFIDKSGKEVIPTKFEGVKNFKFGLAAFRKGETYGLIDTTGKEVTPARFEEIGEATSALVPVKLGGMWGCVNRTGEMVLPAECDDIGPPLPGEYRQAQRGEATYFIDGTGREFREK